VENAWNLVKPAVENYLERGFNNLSVAFGCTGGQHRSVYCAEQLKRRINDHFDVTIDFLHREQ
jgi:RNase adaptor protein for sRNA GlmZ degradation